MVAVVVKTRRKKKSKEAQSQSRVEDIPPIMEDAKDNVEMYQNVQVQSTPTSRHNVGAVDATTYTPDPFSNPASATASFNTHVYDTADLSKVVERPLVAGGVGLYEEVGMGESTLGGDGGYYEEPVSSTSGKRNKYEVNKPGTEVLKPEVFYTQPNKVKEEKGNERKDRENKKSEQIASPCGDLYAQPDMTKKKDRRSQQQWEQKREKCREDRPERDEDEEDIPEVPLPYVPDEELYYNTRGGSLPQDGNYDYAVVDRQQK